MQTAHRWPQAKTTRFVTMARAWAWDQSLHAMDYLEYAYLQLGQDHAAKELVDDVNAFREATPGDAWCCICNGGHSGALCRGEKGDWVLAANLSTLRRRQCPGPAFPGQRR